MHDLIFCQSFQPPEVTLLGLKLHNYTIGHEIALIRQGNPLVTYSEKSFDELPADAKRLAVVMAVNVCCKKNRVSQWLMGIRSHNVPLNGTIATIRQYLTLGSQDLPLAKMPRTQGVPFHYFGAPELARLLNYVTGSHQKMIDAHFGGSPLNFPFGLAKMLYSAHLESEGNIWVKNQQDMWRDEPKKDGTPAAKAEAKILVGDEAQKEWAAVMAKANQKN